MNTIERNKGFTVILLGVAIVLLIVATSGLDSPVLEFEGSAGSRETVIVPAVDRFEELFQSQAYSNFVTSAGGRDVFATRYFDKPKAKPKPEPGTREVPVKYMGSMVNSRGEVTAFLRVDDQLKKLTAGDGIIADWMISEVTGQSLVLTNRQTQSNSVAFDKTLMLTIPIN